MTHQNLLNDVRELLREVASQEATISAMGNKTYKKIGLTRQRLDAFLAEEVLTYDPIYLPANSTEGLSRFVYAKLLHTATTKRDGK